MMKNLECIDCALSEYQDHFDGSLELRKIAYERVQDKISAIFFLTKHFSDYAPLLQMSKSIADREECLHTMQNLRKQERRIQTAIFVTTRGKNQIRIYSSGQFFIVTMVIPMNDCLKCYNKEIKRGCDCYM